MRFNPWRRWSGRLSLNCDHISILQTPHHVIKIAVIRHFMHSCINSTFAFSSFSPIDVAPFSPHLTFNYDNVITSSVTIITSVCRTHSHWSDSSCTTPTIVRCINNFPRPTCGPPVTSYRWLQLKYINYTDDLCSKTTA